MRRALAFAAVYALGVGFAFIVGTLIYRREISANYAFAIALFAAAAALAAIITAGLVAWLARRRPTTARFALALILLATLTAGFSSFFLFIDYAGYFQQFWQPPFSVPWLYQTTFTLLAGAYYFFLFALKLSLPVGTPILFLAAAWLARRPAALSAADAPVRPRPASNKEIDA